MSISENTAKINQLITKINDLPSAAPTVRRVESSFTINPVSEVIGDKELPVVYVECGFKPDVVVFPDYYAYEENGTAVVDENSIVFPELPADCYQYYYGVDFCDTEGKTWSFELLTRQTETGFKIVIQSLYDFDAEEYVADLPSNTFNYVAIKYT